MIAPIKPLAARVAAVIASQGPAKSKARYTRPKIEQLDPVTTKRRVVAPALEPPGSVISTVSRSKQARRALVSVMLPGQPPARIDRPAPAPATTAPERLDMGPRGVLARDQMIRDAVRRGLLSFAPVPLPSHAADTTAGTIASQDSFKAPRGDPEHNHRAG